MRCLDLGAFWKDYIIALASPPKKERGLIPLYSVCTHIIDLDLLTGLLTYSRVDIFLFTLMPLRRVFRTNSSIPCTVCIWSTSIS